NVFLRARTNTTCILVTLGLDGTGAGNGDSIPTGISTNNRSVLFESNASNLVTNDTRGLMNIFVRDLATGTTILVSVVTNGTPANGASRASTMTPDGRFVAFVSLANNLVPNDTNGISDVFVRDLLLGTTTLVSVGAVRSTDIYQLHFYGSESPDITPDGR